VVKNHEVGTRSERWHLFDTDVSQETSRSGRTRSPTEGWKDARAHREMDRAEPQERRSTVQRGSGHEVRALEKSSIREGRRPASPRGEAGGEAEARNLEDTSTPASGANPRRERQGRGGSEQRPTSSRRPGSRDTTDMTCWKPHDLDVRGDFRRAGLRTKASCFGRL
jgi:hypothetical protein